MLWSNWQGAMWRGAVLAFLFWAGLAWTQSPTKQSSPGGANHIMAIHENGTTTRCRVVEAWKLPDGRLANLLQALESGELITIVDETADSHTQEGNLNKPIQMRKRIFGWGQGNKTPPDGSPVPPQLRLDSGVVVKNNVPPPADGIVLPTPGVSIINQVVYNETPGEKNGERHEGAPALPRPDTSAKSTGGLFPNRDDPANKSQVIDFNSGSQSAKSGLSGQPLVSGKTPAMGPSIEFPANNKPNATPTTLPDGSNATIPSFPKIANNQTESVNGGMKPEPAKKQPFLTRINPFAPKGVIEVVPQVTAANAFGPMIVQGMENKPPLPHPFLGGLWKTPNATTSPLVADGQPVLPTTPSLGSPTVNGQPTQTPPGMANSSRPLVINGNELPTLPTTPGVQPVPPSQPRLGGLWKTPNATAPNIPATVGSPIATSTPMPITRTPDRLPHAQRLQIVNEEPSVPAKPVVAGSTAPTSRPIFGGMFKSPNTTAANTAPTTLPNGTPAPTKRPLFGGLFKAPTATASNTGDLPVRPAPTPITLPNNIGVAQKSPVAGAPAVANATPNTSRPILGGLWKSPNGTNGIPSTVDPAVPTVPQITANAMKQHNVADPAKPWRPGDRIVSLFKPNTPAATTPKPASTDVARSPSGDTSTPKDITNIQKSADFLAQQNKLLEKQLQANAEKGYKVPFSTAMSSSQSPTPPQGTTAKEPESLAIPKAKPVVVPIYPVAPIANENRSDKPEMFGKNEKPLVAPPGQSLLEPIKIAEIAKLPPAPTPMVNSTLLTPERFVPNNNSNLKTVSDTVVASKPKIPSETPKAPPIAAAPAAPSEPNTGPSWPVGAQSALAANSGLVGPVTYIMVPTVTVPAPHNPPMPPIPQMPEAPQLNMHVNGFSPPPVPKGAMQPYVGHPMAMTNLYANPMLVQQMMYQQAMMQQHQQQYAMMQQYGYRPNPYMMQNVGYASTPPSQGPIANGGRYYAGPMPPNALGQAMGPMIYPPAGPQPPMIQHMNYQQPAMPTQQSIMTQQAAQIIRVLRESPYPSQREAAAQSLTSFEWRANPQILTALLQSASQDPAPNVRAGCVNSLGRMKAAVEPVFGTLQALRSDVDPRVRHEVEAAFANLGQAPIMQGHR